MARVGPQSHTTERNATQPRNVQSILNCSNLYYSCLAGQINFVRRANSAVDCLPTQQDK